jgi:hypothetical protein
LADASSCETIPEPLAGEKQRDFHQAKDDQEGHCEGCPEFEWEKRNESKQEIASDHRGFLSDVAMADDLKAKQVLANAAALHPQIASYEKSRNHQRVQVSQISPDRPRVGSGRSEGQQTGDELDRIVEDKGEREVDEERGKSRYELCLACVNAFGCPGGLVTRHVDILSDWAVEERDTRFDTGTRFIQDHHSGSKPIFIRPGLKRVPVDRPKDVALLIDDLKHSFLSV